MTITKQEVQPTVAVEKTEYAEIGQAWKNVVTQNFGKGDEYFTIKISAEIKELILAGEDKIYLYKNYRKHQDHMAPFTVKVPIKKEA